MTTSGDVTARSKDGVPQWDGNSSTFQRYEEDALLWREGIAYHKRYLSGPKLVAELQGAAKRLVVGKPPDWVSFPGGVETLMQHLRTCLGRPQVTELTEYLNQYFRHSRRRNGETINDYVTRKSELYMRAQQALGRVRPHHEASATTSPGYPGSGYGQSRRNSWASEATTTTYDQEDQNEDGETETTWDWNSASQAGSWSWSGYGWPSYNAGSWWQTSSWGWTGYGDHGSSNAGTGQKPIELLPDWVQGWYLLQDAGLNTNERNMIFTALKGDFSVQKVAQELRNQWSEQDLKRRDQQHKSMGYMGENLDDENYEAEYQEAWRSEEHQDDDLTAEGVALIAEAEEDAQHAWAALQQARRTLKEARNRQHQVRMSRKYYGQSGGGSRASSSGAKPRDDSNMTCMKCGRLGHRMANCPQEKGDKANLSETQAAPFVCFAEQALAGLGNMNTVSALPTTAEAIEDGYGVIDGGATKTLGSVVALEAVMKKNVSKMGTSGIKGVDTNNRPTFGFADSGEARCISTVELGLQANGQAGSLRVHALNKGTGPILISVSTLRTLGAIIDFSSDLMVLRNLDPYRVIPLKRSSTGHQLMNLTEDLFRDATTVQTAIPSLASHVERAE
eukprot:s93_g10.t1